MATHKIFVLTIQIHVHKVRCQGARLRPWGPIRLRALTLHSSATTQPLPPSFPLQFHEGLVFRQVIQCAVDMKVLEEHLRREVVKLQLTQGPEDVLLAQLTTSLSRLLFPKHPLKSLPDGTELELLMTPTSRLQSAIGPRLELSTRMLAELCSQEESIFSDVTHGFGSKPDAFCQDENMLRFEDSRFITQNHLSEVSRHYDIDSRPIKKMPQEIVNRLESSYFGNKSCNYFDVPKYGFKGFYPEYYDKGQVHHRKFDLHRCHVKGTPICEICSAYDKFFKKKFSMNH